MARTAAYIDEVFGPQGHFERALAHYEQRPSQIAIAAAVDRAFECKQHLVVEGPCGSGKSFAYLTPAIYHASRADKVIVVVTANIALQEQLIDKDLPALAKILPWPFEYALLKGKSNYLCIHKFRENLIDTLFRPNLSDTDKTAQNAIMAWAEQTESGDLSELDFTPPGQVWSMFSVSGDECPGTLCTYYQSCFATKARNNALKAKIIVSNYHLLFTHLQAGGNILPKFDYAICDEGHKIQDIARDFFGIRVSELGIKRALNIIQRERKGGLSEGLGQRIQTTARILFDQIEQASHRDIYKNHFMERPQVDRTFLIEALAEAERELGQKAKKFEHIETSGDDQQRAQLNNLRIARNNLANHRSHIQAFLDMPDENSVYFVERDKRNQPVLCSKALDVAPLLAESFFNKTQSVIITSATLTVAGRFDYLNTGLGLTAPAELQVPSPFDFPEQCLLIVPPNLPAPNQPDYNRAVVEQFQKILAITGGKTLGLFTSYRNLRYVAEELKKLDRPIYVQGEKPRSRLIEQFKQEIESTLLGTESFWSGIDCPGETLSCLVIDKLPFPPPDDPLTEVITMRNSRWFEEYSLPKAIIMLRQGFGRLIRTKNDRGVVVILDSRIRNKYYGKLVLASLPACQRADDIAAIQTFLGQPTIPQTTKTEPPACSQPVKRPRRQSPPRKTPRKKRSK